ncbi:MAG: PEP-CTERM sorting domain-containing protein [Acidobacteria bacterium]|nr:PEP-CTERM sorting domain-containing protein [Acidobacteriota bacterium]
MMKSLSQTINFSPRDLAASVTLGVLICLAASNTVFADSVTYNQIRQIRHSQSETSSAQNQDPQKPAEKPQEPKAVESPTHPEFVRLPDGRIVKYGPGIICEDECREPITPKVSRRTRAAGPFWFILPPFAAGALVCAILCGSNDTAQKPPIVFPPGPVDSPTPPPPAEIPEPGTLVLVSIGLGALAARELKLRKKK